MDKADRVQQILAECLSRREQGEQLSDDAILESHEDLRPELEAALRKMRVIDAAFDASDETTGHVRLDQERRTTQSPLQLRCPSCRSVVTVADDSESLASVTCGSCDTTFRLAWDEALDLEQLTGSTIGHFDLRELIGKGAFGSVWRAYDAELDRHVAIKLPLSSRLTEEESAMFLREARAAAQLTHPNIVSIHEVGREADRLYIVSDLVEGQTLAQRLEEGRLSPWESARLCCKIARALESAHEVGVIHRDLKPANILLDRFDEPHVSDFGLAKRRASEITLTGTGEVMGTPAYMSPEQAQGDSHAADARSDIYSLGVIQFELLTGEQPFRGTPQMLFLQIAADEPPRPRRLNITIPKDLETICLKCLEKRPERRYPSMAALADDLQRFLDRKPIVARPVGAAGRAIRWCQRKPALATAFGLLALAIIMGLAGVTWQWQKTKSALVRVSEQRDRADQNKQQSWQLIKEFLVDVSQQDLFDQPGMGEVRARLLRRASEHLERLAAENTDDRGVQISVAESRSMLGGLMSQHGDYEGGVKLINQAVDALLALEREESSPVIGMSIVDRLIARGQLASMAYDPSLGVDSVEDFKEARHRLEALIAAQPEHRGLKRTYVDVLAKLGWQYRTRRDPLAESTLLDAAAACEALPREDRSFALEWLGKCRTDLAEFYLNREEIDQSLQQAQLAVDAVKEGLKTVPDRVGMRAIFCAASHSLGVSLLKNGQPGEAVPVFEEAIDARRRMAEDFPKQLYYRSHWATLSFYLAIAHANAGRNAESAEHLRTCIEIWRELHTDFPDDISVRAGLAGGLTALADHHLGEEAYESALRAIDEALSLLESTPDSLQHQISRSILLTKRASALADLGQAEAALAAAEQAVAVADGFTEDNPAENQLSSIRVSALSVLIFALQNAGLHDRARTVIDDETGNATDALMSTASDSRASGQCFFAEAGIARLVANDPEGAIPYLEKALQGAAAHEVDVDRWSHALKECYERVGNAAMPMP